MNRFDLDPKAPRHNFAGSSYDTHTLNWEGGNIILLEAGIHLLWLFCIVSRVTLAGHSLSDGYCQLWEKNRAKGTYTE